MINKEDAKIISKRNKAKKIFAAPYRKSINYIIIHLTEYLKNKTMDETIKNMLLKLTLSKNESCSLLSLKILANETTIENELQYCGGFMKSVLTGDYESAINKADLANREALTRKK